jgi:hypothetical protein
MDLFGVVVAYPRFLEQRVVVLPELARPMLAVSGGRLILLSTPRGKRGIFWRVWEHDADWTKVRVTAYECPRITKEYLERERRNIGDWWFAQEYLCSVVEIVRDLCGFIQQY